MGRFTSGARVTKTIFCAGYFGQSWGISSHLWSLDCAEAFGRRDLKQYDDIRSFLVINSLVRFQLKIPTIIINCCGTGALAVFLSRFLPEASVTFRSFNYVSKKWWRFKFSLPLLMNVRETTFTFYFHLWKRWWDSEWSILSASFLQQIRCSSSVYSLTNTSRTGYSGIYIRKFAMLSSYPSLCRSKSIVEVLSAEAHFMPLILMMNSKTLCDFKLVLKLR